MVSVGKSGEEGEWALVELGSVMEKEREKKGRRGGRELNLGFFFVWQATELARGSGSLWKYINESLIPPALSVATKNKKPWREEEGWRLGR
jgi:hypothetical protein